MTFSVHSQATLFLPLPAPSFLHTACFHPPPARPLSPLAAAGTLISFSWLVLLGLLGKAVGAPAADALIDGAALWILLGQVNLYRRVNELCSEEACGLDGPPLYAWWALLPPPLDVVVGLRQVRCRRGGARC